MGRPLAKAIRYGRATVIHHQLQEEFTSGRALSTGMSPRATNVVIIKPFGYLSIVITM